MRRTVLQTLTLLSLVLAVGHDQVLAQSSVRTSPSAAGTTDSRRPVFDTRASRYDGIPDDPKAATTVVIDVEGQTLTLGDVADAIRALPSHAASMPYEQLYPLVIDQLVRRELMAQHARGAALDDDPIIRRWVRAAADQILARAYMNKAAAQAITEERLRERYRQEIANRPGPEEVRLRVIMTPTEAEANALIAELRAGAEFAALARRASKDPTASTGGDVGFMTRQDLTPEIGAVAFSLAAGQTNAHPVRTATGWFIVRTEERRHRPTPPFAAVRADLIQALLQEEGLTIVRDALSRAMIRTYSITGADLPDTERARP